jgi:hypothetical protein
LVNHKREIYLKRVHKSELKDWEILECCGTGAAFLLNLVNKRVGESGCQDNRTPKASPFLSSSKQ